jgi:hypothetical protein
MLACGACSPWAGRWCRWCRATPPGRAAPPAMGRAVRWQASASAQACTWPPAAQARRGACKASRPGSGRCIGALTLASKASVNCVTTRCASRSPGAARRWPGQLGRQVAGGDGDLGVGVGDVVLELFGPVHRVDRHHHRVGAQNGKVRHHQLRAVLHAQHHAVALLHAQLRQPPCGQALGALGQRTVAQRTAKEHQRRLVGIAPGADGQVVPQRGGGQGDGMGQPAGPELEVRAHRRFWASRCWSTTSPAPAAPSARRR